MKITAMKSKRQIPPASPYLHNPTYHEHVRPVIEASCVSCHSDGQIAGYAPFTNAEDVVFAARDIAFHVANGIMPPWMPSAETVPLKNDRSLSRGRHCHDRGLGRGAGADLGDPQLYVPATTQRNQLPGNSH